jgi:hypothetical protein
MLAVKGGYFSIVDVLVVKPRLKYFSLTRCLDLARNDASRKPFKAKWKTATLRKDL